VSSDNLQAIKPLIDKVFAQMRSRVSEIEHNMAGAGKDQIAKAVCDYVTLTLTAESKSLLSTFYSRLADETLGKDPFLTTKNKNRFYDHDFRNIIYEKYSFDTTESFDYKASDVRSANLPLPVGAVGVGVVLSIALSQFVIIPIAFIVAGSLYYFISENEKNKTRDEFIAAVIRYLDSTKKELIIWFENIESFYNTQVEALKRSISGGSNGQ
jgi:hypothetical protein